MPIDVNIDPAQFAVIESRIRSQAQSILGGSDLKKEIGDFAVERIKYQARIGSPYNAAKTFPPLKDSTISNRNYLAKYNSTHETFEASRSNLTITGQFLESLAWSDEGNTLLKLGFTGTHNGYKTGSGKTGQSISNATLAEYLAKKGFKPFDISLQINQQFINRIKTICLRYIRRGLRITNQVAAYDSQD